MNDKPTPVEDLVKRWEELRELGQTVEVEELCQDHPEYVGSVRRRIDALNVIDAVANARTRASTSGDYTPKVPDQINGYQILQVLGRGGMGVVYKAKQIALGRIVALKVLLAGQHASDRDRERFRHEAEVLAKLQHPGIVQIYEIGETDSGTYIVLEFLDGGTLAEQLDGKPWPVAPAAHLIEQIAEAVEAAHRAGIVHRDLKPGNILLSRGSGLWAASSTADDRTTELKGAAIPTPPTSPSALPTASGPLPLQPKIADFGIAKRLYSDTGLTASGAVVGTPAYMSPEQAGGHSRDTGPASDVYSLGAILYELITGRPPFNGVSPIETLMQVRFNDPIAPTALNPQVPRDLETICLKCLEKDPQKRFPSAAYLAKDLHRFLHSVPILARPPGWFSQLAKWVRRNPTRAAMVGMLVIAFAASIAGGVLHTLRVRAERDRAERNVELATQAVDEMLTEVGEEHLALEPRMEEKRRILLEKALAFYKTLQAENEDNPKLVRKTALAQRRLAEIKRLLGRYDEAETAYGRAIERLKPLANASPDDWEVQRALADSHNFLGEILRNSDRFAEARLQYQAAQQLQEQLGQRLPSPDQRMDLARTHYNLGLLSNQVGELDAAIAELNTAIHQLRALSEEEPNKPVYQQHLARGLFNLGTVLRQKNDLANAIKVTQEAIDRLELLQQQYPYQPDYQHELAVARNNQGNYLGRVKGSDEAEKHQRLASDLFGKLSRDFPNTPIYRQELANTLNSLGTTLAAQKKFVEAQKSWEESASLLEQLNKEGRGDKVLHGMLGATRGNLGRLHVFRKEYAAARQELERGLPQLEAALKPNPNQADYLRSYRTQVRDLAESFVHTKEFALATDRARAIENAFDRKDQGRRFALLFLARCLRHSETITDEIERERMTTPLRKEAQRLIADMSDSEIEDYLESVGLTLFVERK